MEPSHDHADDRIETKPHRNGLILILALLTVPAAAVALFLAGSGATSTEACSDSACAGPSGIPFGILVWGAPVVAALTIISTTFVKAHRSAIWIPVVGLTLLIVDIVVLAVSYRGQDAFF